MSDEVKKEETKAANTEEKSELSDEQLEDASGGTYYKYELKNAQITSFDVNASGNDEAVRDDQLTVKNIGSSGQDG